MRINAIGLTALLIYGFWSVEPSLAKILDNPITGISGTVIEFEDGPSLSLDGLRLTNGQKSSKIATEGTEYLERLLADSPLTLETDLFARQHAVHNRYGDYRGKLVTANGVWVQKTMIEQGYAWWSGAADYPPELVSKLRNAEAIARMNRAGIWQEFSLLDVNASATSAVKGDFVIAKGRVIGVFETPKNTYLNFGEDWRTDFTAAISSKKRKNFAAQGWKLTDLKNKLVMIRGIIRFYNGPYMELDFPEQLEIMETKSE